MLIPVTQVNSGTTINSGSATILTSEASSSVTYVDLATVGPAVTVTVQASGILLIGFQGQMSGDTQQYMGFVLSGANTLAASDDSAAFFASTLNERYGVTQMLAGLTPGSTTVTLKYRTSGGIGGFQRRHLWVIAI